jgi:hypothetical protein
MNEALARELFKSDVGKISDDLFTLRNWKLYNREFPVLDIGFQGAGRTELRIRFLAPNWNDAPPSVELLNALGNYLTGPELPRGAGSLFNPNPHPATSRPFVCMAGSLQYHTYQGHASDVWENYKRQDSYSLGGIMTQLWDAWLKG